MPMASDNTATAVKPGLLNNVRKPYDRSCRRVSIRRLLNSDQNYCKLSATVHDFREQSCNVAESLQNGIHSYWKFSRVNQRRIIIQLVFVLVLRTKRSEDGWIWPSRIN